MWRSVRYVMSGAAGGLLAAGLAAGPAATADSAKPRFDMLYQGQTPIRQTAERKTGQWQNWTGSPRS